MLCYIILSYDSNNKGIHLVGWNKIACSKHLGGLGTRPAREANISLLGKLWVNLLFDKYFAGPRILHATTHNSASATWSSIIKAKDIIKDGFSWRV
uniref:RNA-directed DNA polymerase; Ribonuclease H, putative n=1 Tax=Medicago truncatula TaxID=3880 RepID=Q2HRS7_MEDTR|nr:RNA-directed DNA polymerase; Ribonuclease H, putative [Medicago truncatula]